MITSITKIETLNTLKILKILSPTTWVAVNTHILMQIYKSLILSKLNYSSVLYSSANKSTLKLIDPTHIVMGVFKSSLIESV